MRYIDTHVHAISDDFEKYPSTPLGGKQSKWSKEHPATAEMLLSEMDAAGIEKALTIHSSTVYGFNNEYCADVIAKYAGRLFGVCSVDFLGENNAKELDYWVNQRNFVGCRIFATGTTIEGDADWLDNPATYPAWALAEEQRIPVVVNIKQKNIPQLKNLIKRFPNAIMALDAGCRPNLEGGPPFPKADEVWALSDYDNVFIKIAASLFRAEAEGGTPAILRAFADHFGADRLAWGSGYPASPGGVVYLKEQAEAAAADLSDEEKQWLFHDTAQRIYPATK